MQKVKAALKINGTEVIEMKQIGKLRFYEEVDGGHVYISDNDGNVFCRIEADCNQNFGFISDIVDLTNES